MRHAPFVASDSDIIGIDGGILRLSNIRKKENGKKNKKKADFHIFKKDASFGIDKILCQKMKISKIPGVTHVVINQHGSEADGTLEANRDISLTEIQGSLEGTPYQVQAV